MSSSATAAATNSAVSHQHRLVEPGTEFAAPRGHVLRCVRERERVAARGRRLGRRLAEVGTSTIFFAIADSSIQRSGAAAAVGAR
jgi:hypothetical protein